ncbi:MAG: tRNA (adenosine(37)-N6)-threonylcarbamoyltransferase complex ATPase subunit type 1 TsaE [Methylovulum sp.]|jgi:tRNA threonylcarbamoyladenosine biosynthesis protein TsaE|nr:tRNA (adenosine(37)-N6)-threonylcarbamoyltransferase complex ATPase subunit type 1 TsaE [Methylovulum sp.]MCF7998036.1 tRNA (adenosine(37)-N6)-threonylcarbamoyltransferase complex ATPase subunit type 1 TsaE [Methylovulum sp.]
MTIFLPDTQATEQLGVQLWTLIPARALVFLCGNLGVGKTTLVRGYLRAGGFLGTVKSPTYTLVEEYALGERKICHFDLYRINDPEELEWIGIRDYLSQEGVCFVEWPDKGKGYLVEPDITLELSLEGMGRRLSCRGLDLAKLTKF